MQVVEKLIMLVGIFPLLFEIEYEGHSFLIQGFNSQYSGGYFHGNEHTVQELQNKINNFIAHYK